MEIEKHYLTLETMSPVGLNPLSGTVSPLSASMSRFQRLTRLALVNQATIHTLDSKYTFSPHAFVGPASPTGSIKSEISFGIGPKTIFDTSSVRSTFKHPRGSQSTSAGGRRRMLSLSTVNESQQSNADEDTDSDKTTILPYEQYTNNYHARRAPGMDELSSNLSQSSLVQSLPISSLQLESIDNKHLAMDILPERYDRGSQDDYTAKGVAIIILGVNVAIAIVFVIAAQTEKIDLFGGFELAILTILFFLSLFWLDYKLYNILFAMIRLFMDLSIMKRNGKYFSGCEVPDFFVVSHAYPHVTIQVPVHKEDLRNTLGPTLMHCVREARRYESETGAHCNVVVCDDGLNLLPRQLREERLAFYVSIGVALTARPHPSKMPRRGRFKKAGNLNFSLNLSELLARADEEMQQEAVANVSGGSTGEVSMSAGAAQARAKAAEWVKLGAVVDGDTTYGDYVMLVDSDTRLPDLPRDENGCLKRLAKEMMFDGQRVLFLQCFTGPYLSTKTGTALNLMAPLVGHNAFLNMKVMTECARNDESQPGYKLYWAEDRISEDFDMMMRGCEKGYTGRYTSYAGVFLEGVSFSYMTEYFKISKFACGAAELVYNPLRQWCARGPMSSDLYGFTRSENIECYNKLFTVAYILNFIALALAHWAQLFNLVFCEQLYSTLPFVLVPLNLMLESIFVWLILGTTVNYAFGLRMGFEKWPYLKQCLREAAFLTCLYGSISPKISIMYATHLFGWDINFGVTQKDDRQVTLSDWVMSTPAETAIYTVYTFAIVVRLLLFTPVDRVGFVVMYGCVPLLWSIALFWLGPLCFDVLPIRRDKREQESYRAEERMFDDKYRTQIPVSASMAKIKVGSKLKLKGRGNTAFMPSLPTSEVEIATSKSQSPTAQGLLRKEGLCYSDRDETYLPTGLNRRSDSHAIISIVSPDVAKSSLSTHSSSSPNPTSRMHVGSL